MKIIRAIVGIFVWLALSSVSTNAQDATNTATDDKAVVTQAMRQFQAVIANSYIQIPPTKAEINTAVQQGVTAPPHRVLSLPKLAENLRLMDVSACPQDFRLAWINMIHTIGNYASKANDEHKLGEAVGGLAAVTGTPAGVAYALKEANKVTTRDDIKQSVDALETLCYKYGVK